MKIVVIGAGGPLSNPYRMPPSLAVLHDGEMMLFDTGPGTARSADLQKLSLGALTQVFFTHYHSDHIGNFGEVRLLSRTNGRTCPLGVHGPVGLKDVVGGFELAYAADTRAREAHHGQDVLNRASGMTVVNEFAMPGEGEQLRVYARNGLEVFAFTVDHSPVEHAVGYRVKQGGRSIVITGDTVLTPGLISACKGVDIIFADAMNKKMISAAEDRFFQAGNMRRAKVMHDVLSYHMDVTDCARLAMQAGAAKLVLVHVTPPVDRESEEHFMEGCAAVFTGETVLSQDGMTFEL